jgi:hypothetical protein
LAKLVLLEHVLYNQEAILLVDRALIGIIVEASLHYLETAVYRDGSLDRIRALLAYLNDFKHQELNPSKVEMVGHNNFEMSNCLLSAETLQGLKALLIEKVDKIAEQLMALLKVREIFRKVLEV